MQASYPLGDLMYDLRSRHLTISQVNFKGKLTIISRYVYYLKVVLVDKTQ